MSSSLGLSTPDKTTTAGSMIKIDPARAAILQANLQSVQQRISAALSSHSHSHPHQSPSQSQSQPQDPRLPKHAPRLVAVSKLKPASDVLALHQPPTSHTHFGENYAQELVEKARVLPKTIQWHFIGGLQSNKAAHLAKEVDNLWAVESVDTVKKATLLDKGRAERNARVKQQDSKNGQSHLETSSRSASEPEADAQSQSQSQLQPEPLRVFIQVNTSGEESKSGVSPATDELVTLARHIHTSCPNLQLQGLMTIGAIARSKATTVETENEDFICLREARDRLARDLDLDPAALELSMGMSEDFEGAIHQGSSEVRVGSTIFGERPPKKDAKVVDVDNAHPQSKS
ncbi:hypothetical protein A1O3_08950 [Capronia epimyces CBS 606.96]|uniref:Pyridoxal phosphate homeostasis protein n=1 Tax=Capronia epimyces CBS 606.96 TaxID=1182542 RepID=W9XGV7_9EURO|nr:uncharacterized protein A1O3_08950 [Capronia epimyces CBS 606.96]EXJ79448.1 hypothetical protein A1O3_08950 [Capronia epimyces CBS 606.96]